MNEPTRKPADEVESLPEQTIDEQEVTDVKGGLIGGFDPQPDPPKELQLPLTRPDPPPFIKQRQS